MANKTYNYKGEVEYYTDLQLIIGSEGDAYKVLKSDNDKPLNLLYVYDTSTNTWIRETLYSRTIYDTDDYDDELVVYNYKGEVNFYSDLSSTDITSSVKPYDGYMVRYDKDSITSTITVVNKIYYYNTEGNWIGIPTTLKFQKNAILKKKINGLVYTLNIQTNTDYVFTRELVPGTNRFKSLTDKLDEIATATNLQLDDTLTKSQFAADAKVTGDWLRLLENKIDNSGSFSEFFTDYLNIFNPSTRQAGYTFNINTGEKQPAASNQIFYITIPNKKTNGQKINNLAILVPDVTSSYKNKLISVIGKNSNSEYQAFTYSAQERTLNRKYAIYNINLASFETETIILTFDFSADSSNDHNTYINNIIVCDSTLINKYSNYYTVKYFGSNKVILDPDKVDSDIHSDIIFNKDSIDIKNINNGREILINSTGDISIGSKNDAISAVTNTISIGKYAASSDINGKLDYGIEFIKSNNDGLFTLSVGGNKFLALSTTNGTFPNRTGDQNLNFIRGNDTLQIATTNGSYLSFNTSNPGFRYTINKFLAYFKELEINTSENMRLESLENVNIYADAGSVILESGACSLTINGVNGLVTNKNFETRSITIQGTDVYDIFALKTDLEGFVPKTGNTTITGDITINGALSSNSFTTNAATFNGEIEFSNRIFSVNQDSTNSISIENNKISLQKFASGSEIDRVDIDADGIKIGSTNKLNINKNSISLNNNNVEMLNISPSNTYFENENGIFNIDLSSQNINTLFKSKVGTLEFNLTGKGDTTLNIRTEGNNTTAKLVVPLINTSTISPIVGSTTININNITTSRIQAAIGNVIDMDATKISTLQVTGTSQFDGDVTLGNNIVVTKNKKVSIASTNVEITYTDNDGLQLSDVVNGTKITVYFKDGKLSGNNWEIDSAGNAKFNTVTTTGQ